MIGVLAGVNKYFGGLLLTGCLVSLKRYSNISNKNMLFPMSLVLNF